ncbi:MAG: hypothetical protein JWN44_4888 [Myxococcales bacterium]|nr:hypothetical protein [Myxococcales bacterium]
MRRWVELLLLVALAALPLHRPLVHEAPNVSAADLVAGVALAAYLLIERLPPAAWLRLGVLVITLTPAVIVATDRRRALAQLLGLAYVMLIFAAAMSLGERRRRDALRAFVVGAAVACALGFVFCQRYPWMALPRPVGPTESPAMLSMIALAGLFALRALGAWRPLAILFWAILVAAQSRILLCAIVGVAVEAWPRRRVIASMAIAGALALFVLSLVWRLVPVSSTAPFVDRHPTPYRVCHQVAWRAFADHPLTGVGLRGFHAAWPRYVDEPMATAAFSPMVPSPRDPHGTLQGYLAEAGLPALLLLGFLAWDVWRRRGSPGYFVALVLASCTLDLLTERSSWALLGLISAGYHWPNEESTKR